MPLIVSSGEACGVNQQEASIFLSFPIEIRHPIYSYAFGLLAGQHVQCVAEDYGGPRRFKFPTGETHDVHPRFDHTRFRLSPCILDPGAIAEDVGTCGDERDPRDPNDPKGSTAVFHRRLASTWGPHWACEELALNRGYDLRNDRRESLKLSSALRACKKMYLDIVTVVIPAIEFFVTDLRTLSIMLGRGPVAPPFSFVTSFCPRITKLSITLSTPLSLFKAVEAVVTSESRPQDDEKPQDGEAETSHDAMDTLTQSDEVDIWTWLLPSHLFTHLPQLQKLAIYLDHTSPKRTDRWGVVNERAFLAPILALKTANPDLELVCALPKIHPWLEDGERQFLPHDHEWPPSRLGICRYLRTHCRILRGPDGQVSLKHNTDWPAYWEPGGEGLWGPTYTVPMIEGAERRLLQNGSHAAASWNFHWQWRVRPPTDRECFDRE
ncbi:hypothetical protein QBC34DRAFT_440199 [Podospora aff. communis PSN243]|uniref:Uncharacterized protein n=1 Tax=Podospora aff. communis PSN243 TaxID=3040156 RepID=A0AAV9GFF0_9PEZI|nr:hypothetical protein QBC34DRAFT_440199 [Podospora aff. communis PSN243]